MCIAIQQYNTNDFWSISPKLLCWRFGNFKHYNYGETSYVKQQKLNVNNNFVILISDHLVLNIPLLFLSQRKSPSSAYYNKSQFYKVIWLSVSSFFSNELKKRAASDTVMWLWSRMEPLFFLFSFFLHSKWVKLRCQTLSALFYCFKKGSDKSVKICFMLCYAMLINPLYPHYCCMTKSSNF